jgi:tryptophanyl-tRNA synthetase
MTKKRVLSGTRPTGSLHLGNYFGAIENWVKLQNEYDCYFFIADWHALTTGYEKTDDFKDNIKNVVIDLLASGLDSEKCSIFIQSTIKEHAELHLLFSMSTPLSWLLRCPTYKDQLQQMKDKNITTYGFLGYPCLQAADILMYNADYVPVGEDQLPHIELTREIARRFNFLYEPVFNEPEPLLTKAKVLPGTDGRKMSKSYNNTIALSDDPDTVNKKVMGMITDPARIKKTDPGHPDICSVFAFHKVFNEEEVQEIEKECKAGERGCVQCKRCLSVKVQEYMTPIYDRRQEIINNEALIYDTIEKGNNNARKMACETMEKVRSTMKIDFLK